MCTRMRSLLHQYFLLAAMLVVLLFLTSLWLPQGAIQSCESSWVPCLSVSSLTSKVDPANTNDPNKPTPSNNDPNKPTPSNDDVNHDSVNKKVSIIGECPGQKFQVSHLLFYLNSALGSGSDVLLEPYLLCWEELIKFMEALGPLVGFFTNKVQEKITLIRALGEEDAKKNLPISPPGHVSHNPLQATHNPQHHAYFSVQSMLEVELQRGVVNFDRQTSSGSRTLLRLHRSLLWLQLLLEKLGENHDGRSLGELCGEAYSEALAPYHPWLLQQAAWAAFHTMPHHSVLLLAVCVHTHEQAQPIIHAIVAAIKEVRRRTHRELEQRNMLDLP